MNLIEKVVQNAKISDWQEHLGKVERQLLIGLSGSLKNLVMASALNSKQKKILIVTPDSYQANNLVEDLQAIIGADKVYSFPVNEMISAEVAVSSPEARAEKIATLDFLSSEDQGIVVVPVSGVRKFLPSPKVWQENHLLFEQGQEQKIENLNNRLFLMGYKHVEMTNTPGEFSVRGSIVDVYPLNADCPYRIEFFDTTVDSIRTFDAQNQRSLTKISSLNLSPATDLVCLAQDLEHASKLISEQLQKRLAILKNENDQELLIHNINELLENLANGHVSEEDYLYSDFLYQKKNGITDYLAKDALIFIDDYPHIQGVEQKILEEEANFKTLKLAEGKIFSQQEFGRNLHDIFENIKQNQTFFTLFQKGLGNLKFETLHNFTVREMQRFFAQMPLFKAESDRWLRQGNTVVVFVPTKERQKSVENLFHDFEIAPLLTQPDELQETQLQITQGRLTRGFEWVDEKLIVLSEHEIFQKTSMKRKVWRKNISNAERLRSYNELAIGDYVVHVNHGIGRFLGIETIEMNGVHQDYLSLSYQNDDKIFVPVTKLNLISKYTGSSDTPPKVNRLADIRWKRTRAKVTKQIEDIADDLIALYAARESQKGFAFQSDDEYQQEFEDAFTYVETEDQLRSIQEIKRDMERSRPMDRLLIGDVGFGKTEVALRAAFKAICNQKQVAFLVPTTILAQQHFETMQMRFDGFPVNAAGLSRFKNKKEQSETIEQLKKGKIDIIVGTHRLLSKDVKFSDLGLLIIDEEQRFGVKHKERLKQLRSQVDVLTLTATPIPRTLHMSMMGVRDLSVIETPPADRYPVQTYVMETDQGTVRAGILRELARGGQVFYLYNRVETIESKTAEIRQLLPEAQVAFAHGQMTEIQLENVLYNFVEGKIDVLVSTTIIETGVDIPNANTLFVEDADHMGLATLYQLRGRVGRSNRVAYAYFMYKPAKILNEVSEKRLEAIKNFTELGSGFKVAMRDLSIRGAGNILGAEQHGFIDAVGFDMYSQMLEEAVKKKQDVAQEREKTNVEIDLTIDAYIPTTYICDERQKIEIYKRIRQIESEEMYNELTEELIDRFGEIPEEVSLLLMVGLIKMNAEEVLVEIIKRKLGKKEDLIIISLNKKSTDIFTTEQIFIALNSTNLKATIGHDDQRMEIKLAVPHNLSKQVWLQEITQFLAKLRKQKMQEKIFEKV